jgi:dodecin
MSEHVYKVIEVIGSSPDSFEKAASSAIEAAGKHLTDLRIAEVISMDVQIADGKPSAYRTKMKLSFKYHPEQR